MSFLVEISVIIIWLYAGNSLVFFVCPGYVDGKIKQSSFMEEIVTIFFIIVYSTLYMFIFTSSKLVPLQRKGQSAGNPVHPMQPVCKDERDIVNVFEHINKHKRPSNDKEIGYYLAGLIEGDGYIGERGFEILFFEGDVTTAYFIKKWIGYGSISKVKDKRAYKLSIFSKKGQEKLWSLVNGKFQGPYKIAEAKKRGFDLKFNIPILPIDNTSILTTYWLAGFADADGNFSIFISKSKSHKLGKNITVPFRITQKNKELLLKIIAAFQGGILYQDVGLLYRYSTTTFVRAVCVANYFDKFQLINEYKWLRYTYWRKALILIKDKQHLTKDGLEKIEVLKKKINQLQ